MKKKRNIVEYAMHYRQIVIMVVCCLIALGIYSGGSGLWMPMGTVICYGTLISMVLILTVVPIAYLLTFEGTEKKRMLALKMEEE